MKRSKWDQRIQRADQLAAAHPFASEVLQFYKRIANCQKALYSYFEGACGNESAQPVSGFLPTNLDVALLLPKFSEFLSKIETGKPEPVARSARNLNAAGSRLWEDLLVSFWRAASEFQPSPGDTEGLLAWLFLQPYAEYLGDHGEHTSHNGSLSVCPFCSGKPLVGVLRPEGDGAQRSLICAVCLTEWKYGRIVCPACGEEEVDKLAVYTASQLEHVRVEACDTCHRYIKTVDLTRSGLAVPVVDELATIPLNLWAEQHEYVKLQANLLGI